MKTLLLTTTVLCLAACTDPNGAVKAIEDMGMTPLKVGGYSWFGCSNDDTYATKFTAKNSQGRDVNGVVCSGLLFKGATVRTF